VANCNEYKFEKGVSRNVFMFSLCRQLNIFVRRESVHHNSQLTVRYPLVYW